MTVGAYSPHPMLQRELLNGHPVGKKQPSHAHQTLFFSARENSRPTAIQNICHVLSKCAPSSMSWDRRPAGCCYKSYKNCTWHSQITTAAAVSCGGYRSAFIKHLTRSRPRRPASDQQATHEYGFSAGVWQHWLESHRHTSRMGCVLGFPTGYLVSIAKFFYPMNVQRANVGSLVRYFKKK